MKIKKREIGCFAVLIILTLLCKQTIIDAAATRLGSGVEVNACHLKIVGVLFNVFIGYIGLVKHEVKWIKIAWLSVYGMLFFTIAVDKLTEYTLNYSLADFNYGVLVSPVFYLAACVLPRYVALDGVNLYHQKAK
jgi:hypothetical protein